MARSRRSSRGSVRRRKRDWVYRANFRGIGVAPFTGLDSLGTYEFQVRSLTTGASNAQVLWLIDANDRKRSVGQFSATTLSTQSPASQPEPERTKVLAVEGIIYVEPSTWAAGNLMAMGCRIGAFEQDIQTGLAVVDTDMTMWSATVVDAASIYANDRQLTMYEQRAFKSFGDNGSIMVMRIRARLNWTLQSHHGLGLWWEGESTSVNVRYQTWLRTLVEA